jgi:hypothetical protein
VRSQAGREEGGAAQVGLLPLADAAGEHSLREGTPYQDAHPVALRGRQHLAFDAAAEDRVGRLLGAEPLQAASGTSGRQRQAEPGGPRAGAIKILVSNFHEDIFRGIL